jgi:predicted adenylyl cyclase CyaB
MATNIEIKARIKDLDRLRARAEELSDVPGELISQEDTFFLVPSGRLKLRVLAPDRGELIYYERADASGPRPSDYIISPTSDPESLKALLSTALGVRGVVRKQRWLYLVGNTRIHLDEVAALGSFLELEVVLDPGQTAEAGEQTAVALMTKLGIETGDLVEMAYIDLVQGGTNGGRGTGEG